MCQTFATHRTHGTKTIGERGAEQTWKTWISFCFLLAFSVVYVPSFASLTGFPGPCINPGRRVLACTEATLHYAIMYFSH